jgi:uncharacterized repeat protein (TIGR01451 family)
MRIPLRVRSILAAVATFVATTGLVMGVASAIPPVVGANVNVSRAAGNQLEAAVAIDPTNTQRVFVGSNDETRNLTGIFTARSADGGSTWTTGALGTGAAGDGFTPACCDPTASWDAFGNLFVGYLGFPTGGGRTIELFVSTNGGATFTALGPIATGPNLDQPTVTTGAGAVWVTWRQSAAVGIQAAGATITALGTVGAFTAPQTAPGSAGGNFGDIAIGPGGEVLVTYQIPSTGQGPATILTNLDADGLGAGGFAPAVTATATNVGGFDFIPPQPERSVDAEAGLAYDRSGGPQDGRVYLVYTDEAPDESNDLDIFLRFSDNDGTTWSAPAQVNDDATTRSQFLPRVAVDQSSGDIAFSWHDSRLDDGSGPNANDIDGTPNNDAQLWGTFSIDGGATVIPNVRISAGTSDEDGAQPPAACCADLDYGDYTGLAFEGGVAHPAWADNSNSTGDNPAGALGTMDIYTTRILPFAAGLSIAKSDSPDPVAAGAQLDYTITVQNDGPDAATGVVVTDVLPSEVTFVSSTVPCVEAPAGTQTCSLGTLASGGSTSFTITVLVDADLVFNAGGPTTITNTTSVASDLPDPDVADNSDSEVTTVVAEADLEIVSFDAVDPPSEILVGDDVTITLQKVITNNGPSAPIDTELTLTASASPGAMVTPTNLLLSEPALELGELREVEEEFTVSCQEPSAHTFTFTNVIEPANAADTDPNPANNDAELTLEIECVAPVTINIKPGSFPNSVNVRNRGAIPVAVLTTAAGEGGLPVAFDATTIDPLSVRFGPADEVFAETGGAFEFHGRGHIEDAFELDEVTKDGDIDMVLHFRANETGLQPGDTEACVKGDWVDSGGGVHSFFGCDSVRTVPPGK